MLPRLRPLMLTKILPIWSCIQLSYPVPAHPQQLEVFFWLQVAQLQEQVSARDATLRNIHAARDQQQQQLLLAMGKDKQELDAQARLLRGSSLLCGACLNAQLTCSCSYIFQSRGAPVPLLPFGVQAQDQQAAAQPGRNCCLSIS